MVNVVFTGVYRNNPQITNLSLKERLCILRDSGVDNIFWYTWLGHGNKEVEDAGVKIILIDEPYPHVKGISGRQRQIYNVKKAIQDFNDEDIILKLRWDLDFNSILIKNLLSNGYLDKIENGIIKNKIWTGFYSIQEMFSPSDKSFAGYKRDLNKLINFQYKIDNVSSNNYISHDGMMLMPIFIESDQKVKNFLKRNKPDPWSLMFKERHIEDEDYVYCWAYSYYIFHKYFKTGPLGTCYFKRGDMSRWPMSIVDYNRFLYNYETVTGKQPKLGLYPRYRVYDDIFIHNLVTGFYSDIFAKKIKKIIDENINKW
tara:strand:+ start:994 stop:1935 length:942 start_codon:yes stop_codon:yes gene_type:complete